MGLMKFGEYSKDHRTAFAARSTFVGAVLGSLTLAARVLEVDGVVGQVASVASLVAIVMFLGGLIMTIRFLPVDIESRMLEVIASKDEVLLANSLRMIVPSPETLLDAVRNKDEDGVGALAGEVIYDFIKGDVTRYLEELAAYLESGDPVELRHVNAVYSTLDAVLNSLPDHSCWLGVTHLGSPDGWEADQLVFAPNKFATFQRRSIERVEKSTLTILRVYITTEADLPLLRQKLEQDEAAGLGVKVIVISNEGDRSQWPDVSLLWAPGPDSDGASISTVAQLREDPADALAHAQYDRLYALEFQSHNPTLLSTVKVTSAKRPPPAGKHQNFTQLMEGFQRTWDRALTLEEIDDRDAALPVAAAGNS